MDDKLHPILFWTIYPVVWVNFLGFPIVGIVAIGYFGAWGALYFPIAFGFILWAAKLGEFIDNPDRTWRDHLEAIGLGVIGGPIVCAGLAGALTVLGMMGDSYAQYRTELDRCKRQAATPHEYHQCR